MTDDESKLNEVELEVVEQDMSNGIIIKKKRVVIKGTKPEETLGDYALRFMGKLKEM